MLTATVTLHKLRCACPKYEFFKNYFNLICIIKLLQNMSKDKDLLSNSYNYCTICVMLAIWPFILAKHAVLICTSIWTIRDKNN